MNSRHPIKHTVAVVDPVDDECVFHGLRHGQLHWLPVKQRVEFKQALFMYNVLRQTAPPYLADMCQPVSTSSTQRHLHSAAHGDLVELRCRTTRYGKRSFPASAPLIWNSLPTTVRDVSTLMTSFSRRLKAELFRRAYGTDLAPM